MNKQADTSSALRPPSSQNGEGAWLRRVGVWLFIGALLLVLVRGVWGWVNYPHDYKQVARNYAAVRSIQKPPVINHAENKLGLVYTTARGVGVFVVDATSGKEAKVAEVKDEQYWDKARLNSLFGWSTDDSIFAFSWSDRDERIQLQFWNGDGTERMGELELTNGITSFAWLSSNSCVYLDRDATLVYADNQLGYWWGKKSWTLPRTNGMPRSLMRMNLGRWAWQTDNHLWQMDMETGEMAKIYSRPGYAFEASSYFERTEAFLVAESTNRATTSVLFALTNSSNGWMRSDLARMPTIRDVEWLNDGKGYACHVRRGEQNYLAVRAELETGETSYFKEGGVISACPTDGHGNAFALAVVSNEPPSVWRCDGKSLALAFPAWGEGGVPRCQSDLTGYAPYDTHNARFTLVPPAHFSRAKKYPLVIGLGSSVWAPVPHAVCVQTLANSGAYVAMTGFVFREDSRAASLQHTNQINAIYSFLAANPNVDTNRVYIFAFSASTAAVCEQVKQFPGRYRGIILLHPAELPKAVAGITGKVLVTDGSENPGAKDRLIKYQEELCKAGIPMRWFIHEGGGHIARAQDIMRERAELMTEMVFEK